MKQHKIIIETENVILANIILELFSNETIANAIMDSELYQQALEKETVAEMIPETETYFDDRNGYKSHKVQIATL